MTYVVEQVASGLTWPLRQEVLRPHQRVAEMAQPGDDAPTSAHFAAYAIRGPSEVDAIVGVASVQREDEPDAGMARWRLRGMATAAAARRTGVGAALLTRVVEHVERSGGGGLWANARLGALEFYVASGFEVVSEEFDIAGIGPHRRVRLSTGPG